MIAGRGLAAGTVLTLFLATACAPSPGRPSQEIAEPVTPVRNVLVLATQTEPDALSLALGTAFASRNIVRPFNANLTVLDDQGRPHPQLAEALPQLGTESWRLNADGTMETTYRLRPGLTWHDGTPLLAQDFVRAWRVYSSPDFGVAGRPPQSLMAEVRATDDRSLLVRWRQTYPEAGMLGTEQSEFLPLPRSLEDPLAAGDVARVVNDPYWTREYIGVGPYRLNRWELGSFLEASAFDGYALGRPKIESLRMIFIRDPNAALSHLLAGEADLADNTAIRFEQGTAYRRSGGMLILSANVTRAMQVQLKSAIISTRALLDARVRRALAHAVDKSSLNEALFEGEGLMADTVLPPSYGYSPQVDQAIVKYGFDLNRSRQLMREAGFTPDPDGRLVTNQGERLSVELWEVSRVPSERQLSLVGDFLKTAGLDVSLSLLPAAQATNHELKQSFPGLMINGGPADEATALRFLTTSGIPTAENRWSGGINYGGWSNLEFDRRFDGLTRTLDSSERARLIVEMARILSEDVPWVFLYYDLAPVAHSPALRGPRPTAPGTPTTWDIHAWAFTR